MSRQKDIGTRAETAIARYARERGFPHADRLALSGITDRGDVRLTRGLYDGVILEVKAGKRAETAAEVQIGAWLREAEAERDNAHAAYGFLVTKRAGKGDLSVGDWWAHTTVGTLVEVTRGGLPSGGVAPVLVRLRFADLLTIIHAHMGE